VAIARVQDAAFDHDTGGTGAWTVTLGATPTSGNVLYAVTGVIGTTVTFTPPSGWTSVKAESTNSNVRLELWRKVAGGSEPSSYAWTPSIGAKGYAWVGEYSGVDTTTPEDASASGTVTSTTTASATVTVGVANAWTITAGIGRHNFTGSAQAITDGDASDSTRHTHGSNAGSGFDTTCAVFDSNRALSAGADGNTLTSNTTESVISWIEVSIRPSGAALTAGVYMASASAPQAAPSLTAGVYVAALSAPAPGGGLLAGIYMANLSAPLPAGSVGNTGNYVLVGVAWHTITPHTLVNGEW
jgi:hypothetical protein